MMSDATATGSVVLVTLGAFKLIEKFIEKLMSDRRKNGNGATSGDKDPAYWENKFADITERVMERRNPLLRQIVREELEGVLRRKGI